MFIWLEQFSKWLVSNILRLDDNTPLAHAIDFFIYDTIKILILLFIISFSMGVINTYFPIEKLKTFLSRHRLYGFEYIISSLFGAITPFCSCSSVPLFIGFVQGGIPLGITFSFLITSPLVNEVAIAMFLGLFGWKITLLYVTSGVLLGTVGGWVLGKFHLQNYLSEWVKKIWLDNQHTNKENSQNGNSLEAIPNQPFLQQLPGISKGAYDIVKSVFPYILFGIGLGAAMHGYVPEGFFEEYLSGNHWWSVPAAVILAVPLYTNAAGVVPIVQVLVAKGVPLGTAIAFMMGVVGLSLPEATLLKKVMTFRLIAIFFGTVMVFMILSGYLFNWLL